MIHATPCRLWWLVWGRRARPGPPPLVGGPSVNRAQPRRWLAKFTTASGTTCESKGKRERARREGRRVRGVEGGCEREGGRACEGKGVR